MKQIPLGFGCRSVCIRKTLCLSRLLTVGDSGMNDWDGQLKERGNLDDRPTDEERNVPVKPGRSVCLSSVYLSVCPMVSNDLYLFVSPLI